MAKRCKVCGVKRDDLTEGRCRSCFVAYEANRLGMSYDAYRQAHSVPITVHQDKLDALAEMDGLKPGMGKCKYCGKPIQPYLTTCRDEACLRKRDEDKYQKERERMLKKREMEGIEPMRCRNCGKKIMRKGRNFRYCCDKCRREAKRKRAHNARVMF